MKRLVFNGIIIGFLGILSISCSSLDQGSPISSNTMPAVSANTEKAADDIIPAPGGYGYRGSIIGLDTVSWPHVDVTTISLGSSEELLQVTYRSVIETKAGQTRNNIFTFVFPNMVVYKPASRPDMKVDFKAFDVASGITITRGDDWHSEFPAKKSQSILFINISNAVKSGEYPFRIQLIVNGKDYGIVPCTIKVID